jgi:hypothetical protein
MGGVERSENHHSLADDRRPGNRRCRRHRDPENADPPGVAHLDLGAINFAMPLFDENRIAACGA